MGELRIIVEQNEEILVVLKAILDAVKNSTRILSVKAKDKNFSKVYGKSLTKIQIVMRAYKVAKDIAPDDSDWDKANFRVHTSGAKKLLDAFNDDDRAAVTYLLGKGNEWTEKGLSWTLAAIAKHAWDDRGQFDGSRSGAGICRELGGAIDSKPMDADSILGSTRTNQITHGGEIAQDAIKALRRGNSSAGTD